MLAALAAVVFPSAALCSDLVLFDGGAAPTVVYAADGGTPIRKAAELLGGDLRALTGRDPVVTPAPARVKGPEVIIGLFDSPEIAPILRANGIGTAQIAGKWEVYGRAVVPAPGNRGGKALVIFGSDVRGTIWGVTDLSGQMGISPWVWWADVTPRRVARIAVSSDLAYSKEPTVKYRGIFLNAGKHGLVAWATKTYDPGDTHLGPRTYARIYELMWRLKANTIWPEPDFNLDPDNYKTAAEYAIVRGSSHVEMLLRNNSVEWSDSRGPYNWFTNRRNMIEYWTEAVRKWGKYDNLYTVGLRDKDDFPMQGVRTYPQIADALTNVIAAQRKILSTTLGRPANEIPQVLTLYKEVLPAYMTGRLKLPDDVTMNWPDDNFGYIRELSDARQRLRSGGSGIYYHADFWGPPMAYLWIGSTDPSLMWEEMTKAARFDARRIWMLNVGSIKPLEFLTQFFLALAYDADAFKDSRSVKTYLRTWVADNLSHKRADAITDVLWRYYRLAFDRNPEFMGWTQVFPETPVRQTKFNMVAFGDENARRGAAYRRIMDEARSLMAALPSDRKAAFYELVEYPVDIAGNLNLRQLDLDKSIAYGLQHRASANVYAGKALAAHLANLAATRYYNGKLAGGKWKGWMDTTYQDLPMYETPHIPTWSSGGKLRWGVQVEGGEYIDGEGWWGANLPPFHPELRRSRYLDVFVSAPVEAAWTVRPTVPWIKVDRRSGRFSPATRIFEARIQVSIDWAKAPPGETIPQIGVLREPLGATGDLVVSSSVNDREYRVHVVIAPRNKVPNVSFIEADRIVSMYAIHPDARTGRWEVLHGLGHVGVGSDIRTPLDMKSVDAKSAAAVRGAPSLTYRFATTTADDRASFTAFALPTFPITSENGLRIAVSIDHGRPEVLDLAAPEYSEAWRQHVLTNEAEERLVNLELAPGAHTLTVYALDPGVTLDRFEIAFTGAQRAYGAVPETRIEARPRD
ncbi:MAG: glycosyl hydrolase 115 family protein [Opitutaceae bacterium]